MFDDLIAQGVYCNGCGCYTGQEPGYPVRCEKCKEGEKNEPSSD